MLYVTSMPQMQNSSRFVHKLSNFSQLVLSGKGSSHPWTNLYILYKAIVGEAY